MEENVQGNGTNKSEVSKVFIENWPKGNRIIKLIPIIVAIIALITSLISLKLTKNAFIRNTRPFVWGSSYVYVDKSKGTAIPQPTKVLLRIKNAPARIIKIVTVITINKDTLFKYPEKDLIRYPDDNSEWAGDVGISVWISIMNRPLEDKSKMFRTIEIKYSSLEGGEIYYFKLKQKFNNQEGNWEDFEQSGT